MLTYLLLILSATIVDSALKIAGADKVMFCTATITSFCALTEMLSILENASEVSNINVIKIMKEKISKKLGD
jgi:phage-related holin